MVQQNSYHQHHYNKKLTEKYRVTYSINGQMFIVHREEAGQPCMEFLMHNSGFNYYEPPKNYLSFLKFSLKKRKVSEIDMSRMMPKLASYITPSDLPLSRK